MDTKKLRQKILDLAIHGKLVPQDPNDEPASVLLERIKAEKERLIKEGKIKRGKKSVKTSDTPHYQQDVPFEIPGNWVWTSLGEICLFLSRGKSPKYSDTDKTSGYNCFLLPSVPVPCQARIRFPGPYRREYWFFLLFSAPSRHSAPEKKVL